MSSSHCLYILLHVTYNLLQYGCNELLPYRNMYMVSSQNYKKPFSIDNSITGTGYQPDDAAYRLVCNGMRCSTSCCEGPVNNMECGSAENCAKYQQYMDNSMSATIVIALFVVYIFPVIILAVMSCSPKISLKCRRFCTIILVIICPLSLICLGPSVCGKRQKSDPQSE